MAIITSVLLTTPGMLILGVFSIKEHKEKVKDHIKLLVICLICSWVVGSVYVARYTVYYSSKSKMKFSECFSNESITTLFFIGCIMATVMMDILWQEIYEFAWTLCISVCGLELIAEGYMSIDVWISLVILFISQEAIMKYAYGKADCHAFCCCGIILSLNGMSLKDYVAHMMVTFLLLVVSQLIYGNIGRRLKLRRQVPMIPYIAGGIFVVLVARV